MKKVFLEWLKNSNFKNRFDWVDGSLDMILELKRASLFEDPDVVLACIDSVDTTEHTYYNRSELRLSSIEVYLNRLQSLQKYIAHERFNEQQMQYIKNRVGNLLQEYFQEVSRVKDISMKFELLANEVLALARAQLVLDIPSYYVSHMLSLFSEFPWRELGPVVMGKMLEVENVLRVKFARNPREEKSDSKSHGITPHLGLFSEVKEMKTNSIAGAVAKKKDSSCMP